MQCDLICDRCVDVCPNRANVPVHIIPRSATIASIKSDENGNPEIAEFEYFGFKQERQIIHIDEFCNACGNCATFCTHSGEPFRDKPVFFIEKDHFLEDKEDGWFINEFEMIRRYQGDTFHLFTENGNFIVEQDQLRTVIGPGFKVLEVTGSMGPSKKVSLVPVAEMIVFMESIRNHPVALNR